MSKQTNEHGAKNAHKTISIYERYLTPIILGMNDALIEIIGALAGFTIVLPNNRLIALAGLTAGVAGTLSMAAAEFLSQESASNKRPPWASALATGIAYLLTLFLLLLPYFYFEKPYMALAASFFIGGLIIFIFTYIISLISNKNFRLNFYRMLGICFSVTLMSFLISWSAQKIWGI